MEKECHLKWKGSGCNGIQVSPMNGVNSSVRFIFVLVLMWDKGEMPLQHKVIYEYRIRLLVINTSECKPPSQPHDGCSQDFKLGQLCHRTPIISWFSFISVWIFLTQTSTLSLAYSKMCAIFIFWLEPTKSENTNVFLRINL